MKLLGKRQRKNRSRARVIRARADAKRSDVEHDQPFHSAVLQVVAFHASDDEPCNCFGDDVGWRAFGQEEPPRPLPGPPPGAPPDVGYQIVNLSIQHGSPALFL